MPTNVSAALHERADCAAQGFEDSTDGFFEHSLTGSVLLKGAISSIYLQASGTHHVCEGVTSSRSTVEYLTKFDAWRSMITC